MENQNQKVQYFQIEKLKVEIHPTRAAAGAAAARATAVALMELGARKGSIAVIFATGASQLETLQTLIGIPDLPWARVRAFHMDEYIGTAADHPASFRRYLREKLTQKVQMQESFEIDGTASDPEQECQNYAEELRLADPRLCLLGIGENGHLAFNDPAEANFNDSVDMKIVHLDRVCREQQVAEGWFRSLQEVPERAITLTIPALFRVPKLIVSVPGSRKADIVRRMLEEPITTDCPATLLRTHPDATMYLDKDSAAKLQELVSS